MNNLRTTTSCSCGNPEPHEVARRKTADGITALLWSDGAITNRMGGYPSRMGMPRDPAGALRIGRKIMGEIELYDWTELAGLVRKVRASERKPS